MPPPRSLLEFVREDEDCDPFDSDVESDTDGGASLNKQTAASKSFLSGRALMKRAQATKNATAAIAGRPRGLAICSGLVSVREG